MGRRTENKKKTSSTEESPNVKQNHFLF